MATIKCDICEGTLSMNKDGKYAVCENCGIKHDMERLLVKVEELKQK